MQSSEDTPAFFPDRGDRFKAVREKLGKSQSDVAKLIGCTTNTWQNYEYGRTMPGGAQLEEIARLGFNLNWLLTGSGAMLPVSGGTGPEESLETPCKEASASPLDGDLMGRIVDTIRVVYKTQGQAIPDRSLGEMAAEWYSAITSETSDPGDRLDALAERQIALRRRLRAASANPTADKRPA